jgi:hypothetical protein
MLQECQDRKAPTFPNSTIFLFRPLFTMKLLAWRLKDRVHLVDMIEVGLIDSTWLNERNPRRSSPKVAGIARFAGRVILP